MKSRFIWTGRRGRLRRGTPATRATASPDGFTSCECGPETSCYGCLRSYENQRDHDEISRGDALTLLTDMV
jgi:hypothetical protein